MRLPKLSRSDDKPDESVVETPAAEKITIDITIPRECIHKSFEGHPGPCPRCGTLLQQCYQIYMVMTRQGKHLTDSFVTSEDTGGFCPQCPTVVINPAVFGERLQYGLPHWDMGGEFAIVGVLDLDAVPEEKRHLPFGDDNPHPLVEFTNLADEQKPRRSTRRVKPPRRKRKPPARKKGKKKRQR